MRKNFVVFVFTALIFGFSFTACGRTDFSSDIAVVESDEPIEISGNTYLSDREHYYYTFYDDGKLHMESINQKYQFDGTWVMDGDQITLSAVNTDGEDSVITYTIKHGEQEDSVVLIAENGDKFLLTLRQN